MSRQPSTSKVKNAVALTAFIPETAPFDATQRLWLNGYMAGLLAGKHFIPANGNGAEKLSHPAVPLLIVFGSQTGTAEKLAKHIAKESKSRGCNSRVVDAAAHATIDWSKETNLLVVTSTYGDGDMPDNAQNFWEWLQTDAANSLSHLNFSVLALGDTNYENFCAAGRKIDARLEALGAKRIHPPADCDRDYDAKSRTWTEGVLQKVGRTFLSAGSGDFPVARPNTGRESPVNQQAGKPAPPYSRNYPFPARLVTNLKLTREGSEKETRHFEISLEGSGLNYEAGDALGVCPANCLELVGDILRALNSNGEEAVKVSDGEKSLRAALGSDFDITKPGPEFLQFIAERNATLRELLASERKDDLKKWLWGREIIDLLRATPDANCSPAEFISLLKKLAPRSYSISSSPKTHDGQVHLTINIVRYASHGRARKGIASTFLADRAGGQIPVPVFIQASPSFRLPSDGSTPVIMVGPGTGVAPFRAFLHERRAAADKGKNWLFFGEQRSATDFYYREELEELFSDGHLTKLSTAFSRDQAEKIYVQHRMLEHAAELWKWLADGAHLYVCGDASRMAKDVDNALHKIIEKAGGKSADEARSFVAELKSQRRYQRDVY